MSVRDEGATHYYGDDCPGGHGATGLVGVDLDDQLTPQEADVRDAIIPAVLVDVAADVLKRRCPLCQSTRRRCPGHAIDAGNVLAAVVPLIRAQVADDAQRHYEETITGAWDAVATLLAGGAKESRRQGLSEQYAEGWTDAAATIAETVAEMRAQVVEPVEPSEGQERSEEQKTDA